MPIVTIAIETVDLYAPLCWSPDPQVERRLRQYVEEWLRGHPFREDDIAMIVVTREIFLRLQVNLLDAAVNAPTEIEFDTIRRQIEHDSRITGKLYDECIATLETAWCLVAMILEIGFTKQPRTDT